MSAAVITGSTEIPGGAERSGSTSRQRRVKARLEKTEPREFPSQRRIMVARSNLEPRPLPTLAIPFNLETAVEILRGRGVGAFSRA
jgi:hypothetical protein